VKWLAASRKEWWRRQPKRCGVKEVEQKCKNMTRSFADRKDLRFTPDLLEMSIVNI